MAADPGDGLAQIEHFLFRAESEGRAVGAFGFHRGGGRRSALRQDATQAQIAVFQLFAALAFGGDFRQQPCAARLEIDVAALGLGKRRSQARPLFGQMLGMGESRLPRRLGRFELLCRRLQVGGGGGQRRFEFSGVQAKLALRLGELVMFAAFFDEFRRLCGQGRAESRRARPGSSRRIPAIWPAAHCVR